MTRQSAIEAHADGFDRARAIIRGHELRACARERLDATDFVADPQVCAVHVDNVSRSDRAYLTAFDAYGEACGHETLYVDDFNQRIDLTPEFDHDWTAMTVLSGSELARIVASEVGWVIDMGALRAFDLERDRAATERAAFLALLGNMMGSGQARGFLVEGIKLDDSQTGFRHGTEAA